MKDPLSARKLGQGNRMGDPDIGRQRVDHRAVLFEGELNGSARLRLVEPFSCDVVVEVDRNVSLRLFVTANSSRIDPQLPQFHPHFPQDAHHVRPAARGRGKKQSEHGTRSSAVVAVYRHGWSVGCPTGELQAVLPAETDPFGLAQDSVPDSALRPWGDALVIPDREDGDGSGGPRNRPEIERFQEEGD
jgi:hypothetical protein